MFGWNFEDTQCGAKFFRKKALEKIIDKVDYCGWAIDLDLLYESKGEGLSICEVPIRWSVKSGSKVNIISTGLELFTDIIKIRFL